MDLLTICVTPGKNALQRAIDSLPQDDTPAMLRLAPGVYREKVELRRNNTAIVGSGAACTRITWQDAANHPHPDGLNVGTFRSYTLLVLADGCSLHGLTIENAAGPRQEVGQCVALFADGDGFSCADCTLLSHQDTLYTGPLPPKEVQKNGFLGPTQNLPRKPQRHRYDRCRIEGDVDFIFGGAAAWFENCDIVSVNGYTDGRIPGGYATAASTPEGQKYGYVFSRCRFLAGEGVPEESMYLGRPWRAFAKTVLLHCEIGPHIKKEGWHDWNKAIFHEVGYYGEYGCTGPGSDMAQRADYVHRMTAEEAAGITYEDFAASL